MTTQLVPLPGGCYEGDVSIAYWIELDLERLINADDHSLFTRGLRTQVLVVQVPESEPQEATA